MKTYKHLSFEERFVIERLFLKEVAIRSIATVLGRSPNTVSREVRRNTVHGAYCVKKAKQKAYARRWRAKRDCLKVAMNRFLTQFVTEKIKKKWSPTRSVDTYVLSWVYSAQVKPSTSLWRVVVWNVTCSGDGTNVRVDTSGEPTNQQLMVESILK